MTLSRDKLLRKLADGKWHTEAELGETPFARGIAAWIRLLRLSGYSIAERERRGMTEYRLETEVTPGQSEPPPA